MVHLANTRSELRYRRLFEAARDGILIVDPETRQIIDANPFITQLLGYSHEELLGKELFEIGLYRDAAASRSSFRELQQTGYVRYDDLPLETKDRRKIHVEFVSNLYQEGDHQVIQCNIRDISARKLAEAALRESEDRFKLVARAVSDVVWDWDLMTDLRWWSDGIKTAFGYTAAEIEPGIESWKGRLHADDRQRVVESIHRAIDQGLEAWTDEYRFQCKNGSYSIVQDSGYIIRDADGKGIRMVGGMRDRTEQRKMEAQYFRAQRMESIGTLAGGIAHDLNNVLTPIMMSIELLRADAEDDSDSNTILNSIQTSCHRGADLVRQVLSFARGVEGQRLPIRLKDLIQELKGIIGETFPRDITIVLHVSEDLWPTTGDPTQIHQVLLNIAINARDAMPHGGTLTLEAANITLDAQFAGTSHAAKAGRYIQLRAVDTGLGIPIGIREHIFEPFFTTKELGKGTGLGLATVHAIIKSHGGFVTVDSEVGKGTTFNVYLPADPVPGHGGVVAALPHELPHGHGELILVVDDEPAIRLITQRTLEAIGYRVLTATDGAAAVAVYAKYLQDIAVVLTDIMMPVLDGEATIHVLKRLNPAVRIIAVSGLDTAENIAKVTRTGVHDFLPKPYTAQTLACVLRKVLDRAVGRPPTIPGLVAPN